MHRLDRAFRAITEHVDLMDHIGSDVKVKPLFPRYTFYGKVTVDPITLEEAEELANETHSDFKIAKKFYAASRRLPGYLPTTCVVCKTPTVLRCTRCSGPTYCSPACQNHHWWIHKLRCSHVRRARGCYKAAERFLKTANKAFIEGMDSPKDQILFCCK